MFFFFQAEDGIRDVAVTGVQTCALPICVRQVVEPPPRRDVRLARELRCAVRRERLRRENLPRRGGRGVAVERAARRREEIGRGAGRGRGESSGGAGSFKKKKRSERPYRP